MHPLALAVLGCSAVASAYQLAQGAAAWRYFHGARRRRWSREHLPAVTVLKPLKGPGVDLYANLASFCRQDYPHYQIVFGVTSADDPAIAIVERIRRDFPGRDIVLTVGDAPGTNRKIANLVQMMPHARHDVLVLSDADIRVRPDYLRTLVAPLADPTVGLTTTLYRGRGYFGLASVIESLFINTDFIPMVMMAQWVQDFRYAFGASIAFKRAALDAIGGFPAIADHLADDYQLGNRIAAAGYRLELLPYVVETVLDAATLEDVWRHQLRWARTYRVCQPANWFLTIITHTISWGVLAPLATGGAPVGWAFFGLALACRLGSLRYVMHLLREHDTPRHLWLVPAKDLAFTALWLVSWLGHTVSWSGQTLRVLRDGRMLPLSPVAMAATGELAAAGTEHTADARI